MRDKSLSDSIAGRIYLHNLLLVLAAVLLTGGVGLYTALSVRRNDLDTVIRETSRTISGMEIVRDALKSGDPDGPFRGRLTDELDLILEKNSQVEIIVVCDTDSVRYYHNRHDEIGHHFTGDDQKEILHGGDPYISEAEGTLGKQRRAFFPVLGDKGEIIGFVMTSILSSSLSRIMWRMTAAYIILVVILFAAGALLAAAFMQSLKRTLLGFQPEELAKKYIERTEVLDAMEEGICAADSEGRIIFLNKTARRIMGLGGSGELEGSNIKDVFPLQRMDNVLKSGRGEYNIREKFGESRVLSTRIPIRNGDEMIGAVTIMRDKTEMVRMAEELTGTKYMLDTMRALQHEFKNKMHVILGFLEMGSPEEAREYILGTTLVSEEAVSAVAKLVPMPDLAALLIGKIMRARELGIRLMVKQDSFFKEKEGGLPSESFITIIGNLVENAMDELNSNTCKVKEIELGLYVDENSTIITCDDTGGGIPEDILIRLYDRSTTTKGKGHGIGFSLIREITDAYEGVIHIDTEPEMGTSIEISLPV